MIIGQKIKELRIKKESPLMHLPKQPVFPEQLYIVMKMLQFTKFLLPVLNQSVGFSE